MTSPAPALTLPPLERISAGFQLKQAGIAEPSADPAGPATGPPGLELGPGLPAHAPPARLVAPRATARRCADERIERGEVRGRQGRLGKAEGDMVGQVIPTEPVGPAAHVGAGGGDRVACLAPAVLAAADRGPGAAIVAEADLRDAVRKLAGAKATV